MSHADNNRNPVAHCAHGSHMQTITETLWHTAHMAVTCTCSRKEHKSAWNLMQLQCHVSDCKIAVCLSCDVHLMVMWQSCDYTHGFWDFFALVNWECCSSLASWSLSTCTAHEPSGHVEHTKVKQCQLTKNTWLRRDCNLHKGGGTSTI